MFTQLSLKLRSYIVCGNKILVADDDIMMLTTISKGLQNAGYQVFSASDGDQAVKSGLT